MFEPNSRYYRIETAGLEQDDGRKVVYVRRRFLPQGADLELLAEVGISEGDRLDLLTARTLGDPQQFWRVADANDCMNPEDLVDEPGEQLRVPVPTIEEPK